MLENAIPARLVSSQDMTADENVPARSPTHEALWSKELLGPLSACLFESLVFSSAIAKEQGGFTNQLHCLLILRILRGGQARNLLLELS